jgi:hypothetical protein
MDSVEDPGETFFVRLLMKVDDYGRFHATPGLLKGVLYPLREDMRGTDITRRMAACLKAGLIAVYEVQGSNGSSRWLSEDELAGPCAVDAKRYLKIVKFKNPPRAISSPFPNPPGETCEQVYAEFKAQASARECKHMQANASPTVTRPNTTVTETGTKTGGPGVNGSKAAGVGGGVGPLAGLVAAAPVREFLIGVGVKNPWPEKLANRADLSLEIVQSVWRDVQADVTATDKPACLIHRLKSKSFSGGRGQ